MARALFLLLAVLFVCRAGAAELLVSAAASLGNGFRELAPMFEAAHPGTKLSLNLGASGALLQQIAKGAPADVFASADEQSMDQAQQQGLIVRDKRRDFASNRLVLIVPARSANTPDRLEQLAQPAYRRIAIGAPASVPAGRYAMAALEHSGMRAAIEAKMITAQNVRQALDYVARGEVDAGLVYATDAALMPERVRVAFIVPTPQAILYPIAPLAASANAALAQSFVDFIVSPPAQAVLAKYGFGKP
jgi:molybdate transport system substrate-binding protein